MAGKSPTGKAEAKSAEGATYQAPALDKGLDILELLAGRAEPLGLAAIGQALGRSKNEIYRMALALERRGYLSRTEDDRFFASAKLFELGMRMPPARNLHDAALPAMHALAEETRQSCHLAVRSDLDIVVVARVEAPGQLGFAVRVGYRLPMLQSASGVILFAFQPEALRRTLLRDLSAGPAASDAKTFAKAADAAREAGFHASPSRRITAITDISAPIHDGAGLGATAALTMPFLAETDGSILLEDALNAVRRTARQISDTLHHG